MFRKSTSQPQTRPFSLTTSEIIQDISAICTCEEQRNMLYYCLDEKPPQEYKFAKMEEFLTGSNNLESVDENLQELIKKLETVCEEIGESVEEIKSKIEKIRKI